MSDLIDRQDAIDLVESFYKIDKSVLNIMVFKLKQLPSAELEQSIAEWQKDFREYINMLNIPRDDYNGIMEYINDLPSASTDFSTFSDKLWKIAYERGKAEGRKKGKWIDETFKPWGLVYHPYKCDQCGEHSEADSNYCPNCGCQMNGGEQE